MTRTRAPKSSASSSPRWRTISTADHSAGAGRARQASGSSPPRGPPRTSGKRASSRRAVPRTAAGSTAVPAPAGSARMRDADGARHAGAAVAAVTPRVFREILLVIVLGVVELGSLANLRGDGPVTRRRERPLVRVARGLGETALLGRHAVDRRPVLRADVIALAHALGGIVALPEGLEQGVVGHQTRLEHHQHDLGVPRHAAADFLVG